MRWREPLYTGDRAREHLEQYRELLSQTGILPRGMRDFYLIVSPANENNLMELVPASCLRGTRYRADEMWVLGIAADRREAFAVCERMLQDCYERYGRISREDIWKSKEPAKSRQ